MKEADDVPDVSSAMPTLGSPHDYRKAIFMNADGWIVSAPSCLLGDRYWILVVAPVNRLRDICTRVAIRHGC